MRRVRGRRRAFVNAKELQLQIEQLSEAEQNEVVAFLFYLRHRADPEYQALFESRLNDRDPSHWLTPEEFERRLENAGRG
jgi:hypothetical protein